MHATLLTLLTAATIGLPPTQYAHRLDAKAPHRMTKLYPHVRQAELNTDVPPDVLLGVIYTESNGHPWVRGDGGLAYGLGQVHCHQWISVIQPSPLHCRGLLHTWWAVYVTAEILSRLKSRYGGGWRRTARIYNRGTAARLNVSVGQGYADKVEYFGELWGRHYEVSQRIEQWTDIR